jgi:hypothetical protein
MKSLLALPATLALAGIALASPASAMMIETATPPAVSYSATRQTMQSQAAVQACVAQMQRMAGLNKTLSANYNAERAYDECVTSTREAVASQ